MHPIHPIITGSEQLCVCVPLKENNTMTTRPRGYDPTASTIDLYSDEIKPGDYAYYKTLSQTVKKPLRLLFRTPPPPANVLVVRKSELAEKSYDAFKKEAKKQKKKLWFVDDTDG
jgi:hypothetical protein